MSTVTTTEAKKVIEIPTEKEIDLQEKRIDELNELSMWLGCYSNGMRNDPDYQPSKRRWARLNALTELFAVKYSEYYEQLMLSNEYLKKRGM